MKVVYFNETSTNKWDWKTHVWQDRNDPVLFYQNPQRGGSLIVFGAISSHNDELYYCIAGSTNIDSVYRFFQNLSTEIVLKNSVIVLENHRAHHSHRVVQLHARLRSDIALPLSEYLLLQWDRVRQST